MVVVMPISQPTKNVKAKVTPIVTQPAHAQADWIVLRAASNAPRMKPIKPSVSPAQLNPNPKRTMWSGCIVIALSLPHIQSTLVIVTSTFCPTFSPRRIL